MVTDLIDSGIGEERRLQFILQCLDKNKPLYQTDIKFLKSLTEQLDLKIKKLEDGKILTKKRRTALIHQKQHYFLMNF